MCMSSHIGEELWLCASFRLPLQLMGVEEREGGSEGGREEGRERGSEGGREGGRERGSELSE